MNQQTARNILAFLQRVQLTGSEAPALCEAMAALNELLAAVPPPVLTDKEKQ